MLAQCMMTKWMPLLVLLALAAVANAADPAPSVRVMLSPDAGPIAKRAAEILGREITERCNAKVASAGDAALSVELAVEPGIGTEGYKIVDGPGGSVRIIGNDDRGLLYGVGKFLRTSRYDRGGFTPGAWRGESMPKCPVRGIYFATHFHNFYHDAPIEEVQRYVEDLGLWGYNNVMVWYDMRYYDGFDDPKAVEFRRRLRLIFQAAKGIGLDVAFVIIGNEGYKNSPVALRADRSGTRGDWSVGQVCPSKPEGMKYISAVFGELFEWAADLRPRYLCIWPYDSGGCGCAECRPWGSNGFLKAGEAITALARQKLPGAKIIMATWFFDKGECQDVAKKFAQGHPWPDYILSDLLFSKDVAINGLELMFSKALDELRQEGYDLFAGAGVPMVGFPEISMFGQYPWGGYGANPTPQRFQRLWNQTQKKLSGGFPYSEGIFEDINKIICGQFYWNPDTSAVETVKEYIAYEYSPAVVDTVLRVVDILEQNHARDTVVVKKSAGPQEVCGGGSRIEFVNRDRKQLEQTSEEALKLVQQADAQLTPQARASWRWRILCLRAQIDRELVRTDGWFEGPALKAAFDELIRIYHAENTESLAHPPRIDDPDAKAARQSDKASGSGQ
jgi:hypothetical protein